MIFRFAVPSDGLCSNFGLDEGVTWLSKVSVWHCVIYYERLTMRLDTVRRGPTCEFLSSAFGSHLTFHRHRYYAIKLTH